MRTRDFEKKIRHLNQLDVLSGTVSNLNNILVEKGVVSRQELQAGFLEWMTRQGLAKEKTFNGMTLEEVGDLEAKHTAFIGSPTGLLAKQEKQKKKSGRRKATNKHKK